MIVYDSNSGGTSGSVTAGRLAAADPTLRILILEVGPTTENDPQHTQPGFSRRHLLPTSQTMQSHQSKPSEALRGRALVIQSGQCVGGGSSVNCKPKRFLLRIRDSYFTAMIYTRPHASDFDNWETKFKNPGWGSRDLIPLLRKVR